MASEVFFIKAGRDGDLSDMPERVGRLADAAGLTEIVSKDLYFMLKIHFGERGNNTYINPAWVRPLVARLKSGGAKAFLSDTNTLYVGSRSNAVDHLTIAAEHGFTYEKVGAPLIIADGLQGENQSCVEVDLTHYRQVYIANDARASDGFVVATNVTGHMLTGLAGAIKNVGMGLAGRGGKRSQHCDLNPDVVTKKCVACETCVQWCPVGAIEVGDVAKIDPEKCIGCGECYAVCRHGAIKFAWTETSVNMQEKLAEHVSAVLKGKEARTMFFNFLTAVTRNCNCMGHTEVPEVAPIGVLASTDIVAVDQASADVVNQRAGVDLFKKLYPEWDYTIQLAYSEKIGLGSRKYALEEVP